MSVSVSVLGRELCNRSPGAMLLLLLDYCPIYWRVGQVDKNSHLRITIILRSPNDRKIEFLLLRPLLVVLLDCMSLLQLHKFTAPVNGSSSWAITWIAFGTI